MRSDLVASSPVPKIQPYPTGAQRPPCPNCARKSAIESRYLSRLRACYQEEWKKTSAAGGAITVKLAIDEVGQVTSAAVAGFGDESVDACARELAGKWRLPGATDDAGKPKPLNAELRLTLTPP